MKKITFLLAALFITMIGYSQTFTDNFITYNVTSTTNNTVEITDYNMAGGTVVVIPSSVINSSITYTVTNIAFAAFTGNLLTSVTIPNTVIDIEQQAFTNNNLTNVTLSNGLLTIGSSAFRSNPLTSITIPNSVTDIGFAAFRDNNSLTSVISEATIAPTVLTGGINDSFFNRSVINLTIPFGATGAYVTDPGAQWTGFNSVTESPFFVVDFITYEVTSIANATVEAVDYDTAGGTVVNIPASVTNASITYSVTSIGSSAFENKSLTAVTLPNSLTDIEFAAFRDNALTSIIIPTSVVNIGSSVFRNNMLTTFVVPDSVINLGTRVCQENDLVSVTIGNGVPSIGNLAFFDNQITTLIIGNSVTSIGENSFNASSLTSLTIPDSVITIFAQAFAWNSISNLTLGNNIESIGNNAFGGNDLTNVSIPESVTIIDQSAFKDNQLTTITIPSNVTTIGARAFEGNPLTSVVSEVITPPTITTGGAFDTFNVDRSTIDLTIPLGTTAAYVTDPGALWTGFNSVTENNLFVVDFITYEVTSIANATVEAVDYDTAGGTVVNIPPTVDNNSITYNVTSIGQEAFSVKQLTAITIPNGVIEIDALAFYDNQIASLTIPASVTSIGNNAFELNELATLVIPNTVTSLGSGAFGNNLLTSVSIPNSITSLLGTFNQNQLTTVTIPNSITDIGDLTFSNNNLISVIIANSVTQIGNAAFLNNDLTDIVIPSSVTNIGMSAFLNNPLATVTSEGLIPATIVTGANDTFGVRSNTDLYIPAGTLGAYVTDAGALWTDFNMVFEGNLGTSDFELSNEITILTTTDMLRVISPSSIRLQRYSLYAISGAKVTSGVKSDITTTSIASGIYILKLDFNEGTAIKKVVVY